MFRVQSGADDKLFITFIRKNHEHSQIFIPPAQKTQFLHLTLLETSVFKYHQYNCGLVVVYVLLGVHLLALASVHHTVNITHRCSCSAR